MASQLAAQTVAAPWGGYDTQTPDTQMAANKCRILRNLLPGRPGRVVLRGPLTRSTTIDSIIPTNLVTWSGGWIFGDKVLVADMKYIPIRYTVLDFAPAAPTFSASVVPAGLAPNGGLYPFHARAGAYVYGYTAGSLGVAGGVSPNRRISGGAAVASDSRLLYWTGGNTAPDFNLLTVSRHPQGSADIKFFLNRLWVLGGSVPGTTTPVFPTNIYYSNDLGNGTVVLPDLASSWQTGGISNQISLEGSTSDYGVAYALLNGRLIILRRQSVYMMTGTSPATFAFKKIASIGCVDPGSVIEWDDGIYFLSDTGVMFFDGAIIRPISGPIQDEVQNATWQGTAAYELTTTRMSSEYFMMATSGPVASAALKPKCWLYHVPSQSWSEFTANINVLGSTGYSPSGIPIRILRTTNFPLMFDGTYVYDGSFVTNPESSDPVTQAGRDKAFSGTSYPIPAVMRTRVMRVAAPISRAALHSVYLDFLLQGPPGVISSGAGLLQWVVSYYNENMAVIGGPLGWNGDYDLIVGSTNRIKTRRHSEVDPITRKEFEEIQMEWSLSSSSPGWPLFAEIYDAVIRYQPINDRDM